MRSIRGTYLRSVLTISIVLAACFHGFSIERVEADKPHHNEILVQKNYNDGTPTRIELPEQIFRSAAAGFDAVPAISGQDIASGIQAVVLTGKVHPLSAGVDALTDGKGATNDDDPSHSFFFDTGVTPGRIRLSLPTPQPISEVNLYSWYRDALNGPIRAPIKVRIFASDGTAAGFAIDDETSNGYSLIATVDTTRPGGLNAQGGQHGARVCRADGDSLGTYCHFIFEIVPPVDGLSHTFLTEIDLVRALDPTPPREPTKAGVHFDTEVAPLLARRCLDCHNATDNKGGLDLTLADAANKGGDSGPVLVPGKPDESYLFNRINDDEMPPKHPLSPPEKEILKQWIASGSEWGTSPIDRFKISTETCAGYDWWSLQPVVRPQPPKVKQTDWPRGDIDRFILHSVESKGLSPTPSADKRTLIRRASLDLIGLPPSPEEIAAFEQDPSPDAYPRLIDRLLASPHYGERWGRHWLDVVRFAESQGFERNQYYYSAWKYRDWVIQALNDDLPYDQFVRSQLAGDVLAPNDPQSIIATRYLVCGPYDLLGSMFGSQGMRAAVREEELENVAGNVAQTFLALTVNCARCHDHKFDPIEQTDYFGLVAALGGVRRHDRAFPREELSGENAELIAALQRLGEGAAKQWQESHAAAIQQAEQAVAQAKAGYEKVKDQSENTASSTKRERERELLAAEENLQAAQSPHATEGLDDLLEKLSVDECAKWKPLLLRLSQTAMQAQLNSGGVAHAFESDPPQYFHVLARGNFNSPLAVVKPKGISCVKGLPDDWGLAAAEPEAERRVRLAHWIANPRNPLTARTMVNRLWHYHFGVGIVDTPNDFGFSGGRPSHAELLDWLASEFVEHGWSLKHLHRQIMLSATYQQASSPNPQGIAIDAGNRLLWRKTPGRMDAETLRDSVLMVCGQLNPRMGGPSYGDVKIGDLESNSAYQETGAFNASVNRRTIYRTLVRATTSPFLETLDCANPSVSTPRRSVTTTPLQALALLNNSFMENGARCFADRLAREAGGDLKNQIRRGYELSLGRSPTAVELERGSVFAEKFGLADFCLLLFNSNEFLTIQ